MSNGKNGAKVQAKKGLVVNRRHNRTINQDVARSHPKWVDIGLGVLKSVNGPNYAKVGAFGKLVPLNRHQTRFALKSIERAKEEAAALKNALLGDQAAE